MVSNKQMISRSLLLSGITARADPVIESLEFLLRAQNAERTLGSNNILQ